MFKGIDYEFAPFPQTLKLKSSEVTKTRVDLARISHWRQRLQVVGSLRDEQRTKDYARRWLQFDPDDTDALDWLLGQSKAEDALVLLRTRLQERPLLVGWHSTYQNRMERLHPERGQPQPEMAHTDL